MAHAMGPQQAEPPLHFEEFYRRDYRLLIKVVMAIGGTLDEAHDAVNQTMLELMRRWQLVRNPRAYARIAVVNNFVKQQERDRQGLLGAVEGGHLSQETHDCAELTVWENEQWVAQLIRSLPPAQREVMMAVLEGLTIEQISARFGPTPAAIRQRLKRARRNLARLLHEQGDGDEGGKIR